MKETDTGTLKSQCSSMLFIDLFRPAGWSREGSAKDSYYYYYNTRRHTHTDKNAHSVYTVRTPRHVHTRVLADLGTKHNQNWFIVQLDVRS